MPRSVMSMGPAHGDLELPQELAWSGRRRFDLDYGRTAAYKIILEEGREPFPEVIILLRPQTRPRLSRLRGARRSLPGTAAVGEGGSHQDLRWRLSGIAQVI